MSAGWLIEKRENGFGLCLTLSGKCRTWVVPDAGIRFARQEDAEAYIICHMSDSGNYEAVEHAWHDMYVVYEIEAIRDLVSAHHTELCSQIDCSECNKPVDEMSTLDLVRRALVDERHLTPGNEAIPARNVNEKTQIDAALLRLAQAMPGGYLHIGSNPASFFHAVADIVEAANDNAEDHQHE